MARGGSRPGAGRPRTTGARLDIRVGVEQDARWREAAQVRGLTWSDWVRTALDERANKDLEGRESGGEER